MIALGLGKVTGGCWCTFVYRVLRCLWFHESMLPRKNELGTLFLTHASASLLKVVR